VSGTSSDGCSPVTLAATGARLVKDWARATRPYLQRLRACRAASHTLTAAGRVDPSCLGAGDFTRIIDAISDLRRADGSLHSAQHLNLLLYLI
jgi:1,6-anhydro-N-acetylmuramate kinase